MFEAVSKINWVGKLKPQSAVVKAGSKKLSKSTAAKAKSQKQSSRSRRTLRQFSVILLISFSVALLTVGNLVFWAGNTVVKQDRFVAATAPLIKDSEVQKAMSLYLTNSLFSNIDVQQTIESVLPPRADFLAPQLSTQLKTVTQNTLQKALANPKLQDKWNSISAKQHDRLISFAEKYKGDDKISLNEILTQLTSNLKDTKLAFLAGKQLPPKTGEITVVEAAWLPTFHKVVTNIDLWRSLTILLMVVSLGLAIWISRNRRRTVYIFSLAAAALMTVTLVTVRALTERTAEKADPQYQEGVRHALNIVLNSLSVQTITILITFLLVAFVAWISGGSKNATKIKNYVRLLFSGKLHDRLFTNPDNKFVGWVAKNKRLLQWSTAALLAVVMLLVRLTIKSLVIYSLLLLVIVLVIEVIGGQPVAKKSKRKAA